MKLDKYIAELLTNYDCIIIPEFGGFVGYYSPAKIHPTQHTFTPPTKLIAFNKNLNTNDGLLANHIVTKDNISFQEACLKIAEFVGEINTSLNNNKKFEIAEVGVLHLDVEKNIQFTPSTAVNYLQDSFGLIEFQSPAIKRHQHYVPDTTFVDRPPLPAAVRPKYFKKYWPVAVGLPLIAALFFIPYKTQLFKGLDVNYSGFSPFAEKAKSLYSPRVSSFVPVKELASNSESFVASYTSAPAVNETAVAETSAVSVNTSIGSLEANSYYVIAGCFESMENAQAYVNQLSSKGLSPEIIGKNNAGLFRVSCGKHFSKAEALTALENIQASSPSAWLLKN